MSTVAKDVWGGSLRGSTERRDRILAARLAELGYTLQHVRVWESWASNKSHYHIHYTGTGEPPTEDGKPREYSFTANSFEHLEQWTGNPYELAHHLYNTRRYWWERHLDMEGYRKREEWARDTYGRASAQRAGFILGSVFYLGPQHEGTTRSQIARGLREAQHQAFAHLRERVAETKAIRQQIVAAIGWPPIAID